MVNKKHSNKPEQTKKIITYLKEGIVNNQFLINEQIPSVTELMKMFNVSKNTVLKSINNLIDKGFLTSKPGKAVYVTPHANEINEFNLENQVHNKFEVKTFNSTSTLIPKELIKNYSKKYTVNDWDCFVRFYFEKKTKDLIAISLNWINKKESRVEKNEIIKTNISDLKTYFKEINSISYKTLMLPIDSNDKTIFRITKDLYLPNIYCYYNKDLNPHLIRIIKIKPEYFSVFKTKRV